MSNNLLLKDLKGESLESTLNTVLEITDSQFIHRYSRHDIEFGKDVGGQNGLFNRVSNWALSAVDRNTLFMAFMPAFTKEFKSLTGKEFSYSEIKNPEYQKYYHQEIKDAAAIGDRAAAQWKNISVKGAGRTKIKTPSLFEWGAGGISATSEVAPVLTFMGSFGYLEVSMAQKSIRDMMAGESMATRAQGAKQFASIMGAGIAYGMGTTAEYLLTGYLIQKHIITQSAGEYGKGDDKMGAFDEEKELRLLDEKFNEDWDGMFTTKGLKKQILSNTAFLATSKYSQASRVLAMAIGGTYDSWLNSKFSAAEMSKEEIKAELENNKSWLNELLDSEDGVSSAQALLREGLYMTPTTDVGRLAESLMPHIDNLSMNIGETSEAYAKFRAEGKIYDPKTYSAEHEKFKDEIQAENLLMNALRLYFTFRGTAIPMDKMINQYRKEMTDRYDYSAVGTQKGIKTTKEKYKIKGVGEDRWNKNKKHYICN